MHFCWHDLDQQILHKVMEFMSAPAHTVVKANGGGGEGLYRPWCELCQVSAVGTAEPSLGNHQVKTSFQY